MARLTIIETGFWDVPRNESIAAETPEIYAQNLRLTVPGHSVLVEDPKAGRILYDTGINADWETEWGEEFLENYRIERLCRLDRKLAQLGLAPSDIDLVICSHLHYDHAGNVKLFRGTKAGKQILISEAEARAAFPAVCMSPDGISGPYCRDEIVMPGIGYRTIAEDTWLSEDVFLFIQAGHTPGVIGMLVRTEQSGWLIFASDAVYTKLNFGPPVVLPGLCVDPENYKKNVLRLQGMKKQYNATMVFSHDMEDYSQWKNAPYWYE